MKKKTSTWFWGLLLLFPLVASAIVLSYTPNVPVYDDYAFVLRSCNEYAKAPDQWSCIQLVFSSLSAYMFVPFKALLLLDYTFFDQANISHMVVITHVFSFGILLVLWLLMKEIGMEEKAFVPVIILFGTPHFMALSWATYAAHTIGLFFTVLVFYFVIKGDRIGYLLAFFAAATAAFSAPGGILALVVPLPIIWYSHSTKRLVCWLGGCVLLAACYYYLNGGVGYDIEAAGTSVPFYEYVLNWMLFYGSVGKGIYREFHAGAGFFAVGYIFTLALLLIRCRSKLLKNPILLCMLLLSLLLGLAVTAMRSRLGLGATTAYRYRLYQVVAWVLLYLVAVAVRPDIFRKYIWAWLTAAVFCLFSTIHNVKLLKQQSQDLEVGMEKYLTTGQPDQLFTTDVPFATKVLEEATQLGVYPGQLPLSEK